MITGGKRMARLLSSGKVDFSSGGQILDLYNQSVYKGVAPTIMTTVDSSSMTFVTVMKKSVIYEIEGQKYEIAIRKYTPRDCFRLMGVRDDDIDRLLAKGRGQQLISNSKLYQLAGNSIVTNCMTAMFEEMLYPSGKCYADKNGQLSLF